jgi:hypothetical protein
MFVAEASSLWIWIQRLEAAATLGNYAKWRRPGVVL